MGCWRCWRCWRCVGGGGVGSVVVVVVVVFVVVVVVVGGVVVVVVVVVFVVVVVVVVEFSSSKQILLLDIPSCSNSSRCAKTIVYEQEKDDFVSKLQTAHRRQNGSRLFGAPFLPQNRILVAVRMTFATRMPFPLRCAGLFVFLFLTFQFRAFW